MCTAILLYDPAADWPLCIAAVRDELRSRAWDAPAEWWRETQPGVIGGRDQLRGGTWLAVAPAQATVAIVFNRLEPRQAPPEPYSSRGQLPLVAIRTGTLPLTAADLRAYDPFNLVLASPTALRWWKYDGCRLEQFDLPPGLHLINAQDVNDLAGSPRQAYWHPRFAAARRPALQDAEHSWGDWKALLAGDDLPPGDPRALNVKSLPHRPGFGSVCAHLIAFGRSGGSRFDFCPAPPDQDRWYTVC